MSGVLAMFAVNASGVLVALPSIQRDLDLSPGMLQWVITAFNLTLAAGAVAGGFLGDRLGRVRAVVSGVCLFSLGSVAVALAPTLPLLIGSRVLQGLAAIVMMPASAVLVNEAFDVQQRGRAVGVTAGVGGLFLALGPVLSGVLIAVSGWRAVFLSNVPLAAVVLALTATARPRDQRPPAQPWHAADAGLLAVGLAALVLGLQQSHSWGWTSLWTWGYMGGGLLLLAVFVARQLRPAEPMLDVRLFTNRGFTADALVLYCAQFGLIGQSAFLAIYLQTILGLPPLTAGLAMLLFSVPCVLLTPVAGWMFDRWGVKVPVTLGMAFVALGFFLQAQTFPDRVFAWIAPGMVLSGLGLGLVLAQTTTDGMARVPAARRGQAYGVLDTMKQLGSAMGMAAIGALVAAQIHAHIERIGTHHAPTSAGQEALEGLLLQAARGQQAADRELAAHWPDALADLNEAGARSIAAGYMLGSAVTALGCLLALLLMRSGRLTEAAPGAAPAAKGPPP